MTSTPILICPSFFGPRSDGISRVSALAHEALAQLGLGEPWVLAANDEIRSTPAAAGRGFGRRYVSMCRHALFSPRISGSRHVIEAGAPAVPIVCAHLGLSPVARMLARRLGRPYFVILHGVEAWKSIRPRDRWGLRRASGFLAGSQYSHRQFVHHNRSFADTPVQVTGWGTDTDVSETRSGERPAVGEFRFLCVARMSKGDTFGRYRSIEDLYKGFAVLLAAMSRLVRQTVRVTLEVVGAGDAAEDIERHARTLGVAGCVRFSGELSDAALARRYEEAHAFVLPSEREGFGIAFVEAMARGLPCVGVAAGGVPEVIENGATGLLVPPGDAAALADAMRTLAENCRVRMRMGLAGRQRFERDFTRSACVRRLATALAALNARMEKGSALATAVVE